MFLRRRARKIFVIVLMLQAGTIHGHSIFHSDLHGQHNLPVPHHLGLLGPNGNRMAVALLAYCIRVL